MVNLCPITEDYKVVLGYKHREGKNPMWIMIGGKRDGNETDAECVVREIMEELNIDAESVQKWVKEMIFVGIFEGLTPHKHSLHVRAFAVEIGTLVWGPNEEILKVQAFSYTELMDELLVSNTTKAIATKMFEIGLIK